MRNTLFLIASVTAAGFTSAPAQAQWSSGGYDDDLIRCESRDGRIERCETYGGNAQFVRQLSNTPCVRGRSWGTDSRGVWVSSGCRAEFRVDSSYGYDNGYDDNSYGYGSNNGYGNTSGAFRCESREGRTERCNSYGGRAQFVRQLSNTPCVRGRSWGSDSRGVWVSNGCRALFSTNGGYGNNQGNSYGNDLVRCESRDNRSHSCTMSSGRNGNIRLLRQLSDKPCIENQTWGRSRTGVWVTQGCRAEFVTGRGGNNNNNNGGYQRPPGDLGGVPGGKRSATNQDTSGGRPPGDLGGATTAPASQRPPADVVIGRPGNVERVDRQIRPVEEAPGRLEVQTVEEAPGQVQRRNTGGTAEVDTVQPAPRERVVERAERPR